MFRGDHPALTRGMGQARVVAGGLGHPRVGSEHLLLALAAEGMLPGVTAYGVREAAQLAAPLGAGIAADREALAPLGVDLDALLDRLGAQGVDRPVRPERRPGAQRAQRRCARTVPALGLDAQAAYDVSLRLALARRERWHRPEHLAMALVALDPGAGWVLRAVGAEAGMVLAEPARAFPPRRNRVLRAERRIGRQARGWPAGA
ncbi:Clp protease N-terminal domain-containing protein [Actinoplanes sp. NPDC051411]|uniref:Clp protease N-terminal domain-containing protein n=1 Tax=Actinoplanes sp. NPDC051411 TaxID=3155522 RepID=UPI003416283F